METRFYLFSIYAYKKLIQIRGILKKAIQLNPSWKMILEIGQDFWKSQKSFKKTAMLLLAYLIVLVDIQLNGSYFCWHKI